jgi:hypothetical protein
MTSWDSVGAAEKKIPTMTSISLWLIRCKY